MKKTLSLVLAFVLLLSCLVFSVSCAKQLNGTYKLEVLGTSTSYTFKNDKVTFSTGIGSAALTFEGTYSIDKDDDGNQTITFDFSEKSDKSGSFSFSEGKEDGKSYIKIAGIRYDKE